MKRPAPIGESGQLRDLKKVSDALHRLYSDHDAESFPRTMMGVAEELVPCINISFDTINLTTGVATDVFDRPIVIPHEEFLLRWQSFCHEHPGIAFLKSGGRANVFAINDFLSQRQFRRTAFYQEFFNPIGGTHQLGVILPVPGFVVGMAMNRDRDFAGRERELVELLHPHFLRAFRNAQLFSSLRGSVEIDYRKWRNVGLTLRECEVLRWLMDGKRNGEIAVILDAQPGTIAKHVEHILAKLGVETRASAGAEARRLLQGELFPIS